MCVKSASNQAFSSNGVLVKLVTPCGAGQTRRKAREAGRKGEREELVK